MERPKDLVDRLQIMAALKAGEMPPQWLYEDANGINWAPGMSRLFSEAAKEIRDLRTLQESYSKLCKEVYG